MMTSHRDISAAHRGIGDSIDPPRATLALTLGGPLGAAARDSRAAFTLVELIISIALVLIVMLGINYVFRMTSLTISSGQQLNEQVRNNRGAQAVMFDDFSRMASDGPFLIIRNRAFAAFTNRQDRDSDLDYVRTTNNAQNQQDRIRTADVNGNGIEGESNVPGEITSPLTYNRRNHRIDVISFFARGLFRRQTGNDGVLIAEQSSNEAWVYFGHLCLPNNDGQFHIDPPTNSAKTNPGWGNADTNPNNFYASSWTLGRIAMLLRDPDSSGQIVDRQGVPQRYIQAGTGLSPLAAGSTSGGSPSFEIRDCRFDLAGMSMARFRLRLASFIASQAPGTDWWTRMMLGQPNGSRFECNPAVVRPMTAKAYSQQSPIFLRGASKMIVEYAGDFVRQNLDTSDTNPAGSGASAGRYGDVQDVYTNEGGTDGQIDFVLRNNIREVRWYGLPRDTTGDGRIRAADGDVVPLRDLWVTAVDPATTPPGNAPFERGWPTAAAVGTSVDYITGAGIPANANPTYTCAWGPDDNVRPQMIRVTIVLEDPSGRLADGQTLEYVFALPR